MAELTILEAGWSVVQDLGRVGQSQYGVVRGGAADQYSACAANALVGNSPQHALLECTVRDVTLIADTTVLFAVTGAPCEVSVDGTPQPSWRPLPVRAGATVRVYGIRDGLRAYVAVNGTLDVAPVLGSVAPDPGLGLGRRLLDGDRLGLRSAFGWFDHPATGIPLLLPPVVLPDFGSPWTIDVVDGPDGDEFGSTTELLFAGEYVVSPSSDAVGLRLTGAVPTRTGDREILSRGVAIGSVEVAPSGELLVLQRGRLLTAGYPVIAVATTSAQSRLGQARPGDTIRFRRCELSEARAAALRERAVLDATAAATAAALRACGLGAVLS